MNRKGAYSQTALVLTTKAGSIETVRTLLKHGVDPNIQDFMGKTALDHAIDPALVALIRAAGGKPAADLR
ncbi:MAG: ankyrin repeat domain-containing protein [Pseudomonadota bacterium]